MTKTKKRQTKSETKAQEVLLDHMMDFFELSDVYTTEKLDESTLLLCDGEFFYKIDVSDVSKV